MFKLEIDTGNAAFHDEYGDSNAKEELEELEEELTDLKERYSGVDSASWEYKEYCDMYDDIQEKIEDVKERIDECEAMDRCCEAEEISRILREVIDKLEYGCTAGTILDINGNKVGEWSR